MAVLYGVSDAGQAEGIIFTSEMKEMLGMYEKLSGFVQKKHPETFVTSLFNNTCLTQFRNIL